MFFKSKYGDLLSEYELREHEKKMQTKGPLSLLATAISEKRQIVVNLRSNRKLIADVIAYDKHLNLVLDNAVEVHQTTGRNKKSKDRRIGKMFLRGDNVIVVVLLE